MSPEMERVCTIAAESAEEQIMPTAAKPTVAPSKSKPESKIAAS
jgi:hypothetical protein